MAAAAGSGRHTAAVLGTLGAAAIWGASYAAMKVALQADLGVGFMLGLRFTLGALFLGAVVAARRVPLRRREVADGLWLGLVLVAVFWLQAGGLRFTTTAKAGFITGLYVLFTPLIGLALGHRLRPAHAGGALAAAAGMYLLVHQPGAPGGGWNPGDSQILGSAFLTGIHITLSCIFSRRSSPWVLALVQVATVALVSLGITACLPSAAGFQGGIRALGNHPGAWFALLYLGLLASGLTFYLMMACQAHLGATESAILYTLEPVFAALLALSGWVPGIRERLGAPQLLGGAVILGGMVLAEVGPRLWGRALRRKSPAAAGIGERGIG